MVEEGHPLTSSSYWVIAISFRVEKDRSFARPQGFDAAVQTRFKERPQQNLWRDAVCGGRPKQGSFNSHGQEVQR